MCGIAGFFGAGDEATLHRMTDRIAHRGPDDDGHLIERDNGVYLGFRRLAILDIADGHQPMTTADGQLSIVFNGEIYNFTELRKELEALGARFVTDHTDTEVLLHGWRQWGNKLPARLNGMWAFAIYDRHKREVFLSRDRFGKKPLFYFANAGTFAFASELTALREHPGASTTFDTLSLQKFFAYGYVPAPRTLLQGIAKLPGGCSLTLRLSDLNHRIERYWQYQPEPDHAISETQAIDEFLGLIEEAVKRRLVADVPVGCFLSGGIDSSFITALASRLAGKDRVEAFSIGFEEATFDETRFARRVADHVGARHEVHTLSINRALEILPDLAARLDEPIADSSILPTYLLCAHARRKVTVALGGDGADELLAGYDPFRALRFAQRYESLVPKMMHRAVSLMAAKLPVSHRYMSFDFRLKRMLRGLGYPPRLWLPVWMAPLAPREMEALFDEPVQLEELYSEAVEAWDTCSASDPVERAIAFYIRLYLQDDILVKVDRASMLHSLEVRAPFLDIALVDFLRKLPASMKLCGGKTKYLLRRAARGILPDEIIDRGKQGFALPVGAWLKDGTLGAPDNVSGPRAPFWRRQLAEQRSGRVDHRLYLWSELALRNSTLGNACADFSTTALPHEYER